MFFTHFIYLTSFTPFIIVLSSIENMLQFLLVTTQFPSFTWCRIKCVDFVVFTLYFMESSFILGYLSSVWSEIQGGTPVPKFWD